VSWVLENMTSHWLCIQVMISDNIKFCLGSCDINPGDDKDLPDTEQGDVNYKSQWRGNVSRWNK